MMITYGNITIGVFQFDICVMADCGLSESLISSCSFHHFHISTNIVIILLLAVLLAMIIM